MIIGKRTFGEMPTKSQFGNRVGTKLLGWAMGQPVPDNQSGYRLLSREVMRTIRPSSSRFEAEVEILLRAQLAGFKVSWVPIKTIYNDKKSHFRPIHDRRAVPAHGMAHPARANPRVVRLMEKVVGILAMVAGIVFPMAMVFWLSQRLGRKPPMRPGQVGLVLALNGVLPIALITTGVALLSPEIAATRWMPVALGVAWIATLAIACSLAFGRIMTASGQGTGQRGSNGG